MNIQLLNTLLRRMNAGEEAIEVYEPFASGPEHCILVFDRSGSMADDDYPPSRLQAAFDAGLEFVDAKLSAGLTDLISIVMFDTYANAECQKKPPDEAARVLRYLKRMCQVGGGTDINSGFTEAEQQLRRSPRDFRKRIILLTDGHGGDFMQTGHRLLKAGVMIDIIGVAGKPSDVAEEDLRKVASVINGVNRYRFIGNRAELLQHFKNIATDLVQVK